MKSFVGAVFMLIRELPALDVVQRFGLSNIYRFQSFSCISIV